ncbi:porin [Rickettsiales endosymbiont of Peranema trichophorum]|uniref:porin n=1 Tax=Rickettsiales endosymbiont of Peranema trichophorum TaxID=2486577 RepID=UPI001023F215|nr:porin [Rickettsiales endosymbiont of Peranema trichophorum]RZI47167.1 porin [Rickettsiales endosymbiont of Peranema trichophorum]
MKSHKLCFVLSLCLLSSSVAAEDGLTVKVGGSSEVILGYRQQKNQFRRIISPTLQEVGIVNSSAIANHTSIDVNVKGGTSTFEYGALIRLHADTGVATNDETGFGDKTMIYVQHDKIGRFEGGNYPGAGGMMEMFTTETPKAAYGVEGFWSKWVSGAAYVNMSPNLLSPIFTQVPNMAGYKFITAPNLPSNYSGHYYSDATKMTFYTQPLPCVTLGVSFIPDLDSTGTINTVAPRDGGPTDPDRGPKGIRPTFKDIISGGIQYTTVFNELKIKASAAGEIGKAKRYAGTQLLNDLKAYEFGASVNYGIYTVGATYGSWTKTGTYKTKFPNTKQGSSYWTVLTAVQLEKLGASLSFMQSKKAGGLEAIGGMMQHRLGAPVVRSENYSDKKYNKFNNVSLGVEYKLAPGLLPYGEVSHFEFRDSAGSAYSNRGQVYLTGLRLVF